MIRYFATNRSLDKLGQAVPANKSGDRHGLARGGYYFVDMEDYMSYYLGTTEAEEMPKSAIVRQSKKDIFDGFLSSPKIGKIVVCVHGFNVELFEAFTWFRILTDTMKHAEKTGERIVTSPDELAAKEKTAKDGELTAFIGFSWPSNGNVFSYPSDQREAIASKSAFAALLARIKLATGKPISLICHSMGNFLACHTFAALVNEQLLPPAATEKGGAYIQGLIKRPASKKDLNSDGSRKDYFVDNYVMIAPDVERRHVTKAKSDVAETDYVGPFYSGLEHLVRKQVNVYSRFDGALAVSNIEKKPREMVRGASEVVSKWTFGIVDFLERNPDEKWEKRLGEAPAPFNASPGFESINATELAGRPIDHSDHIDSKEVAFKIAEVLEI